MRKEWKKSLLVFKMSQRSLFECGVSKKSKDESDFADNAESVPTSASSDQPQQPTKKQKPSSATTGKTHSRFQDVWFVQFNWLEYDAQSKRMFCKVCRAAESKNIFSNEGAGVCIFLWCKCAFSTFCLVKKQEKI